MKKAIALILALTLLLSLCACGAKTEEPKTDPAPTQQPAAEPGNDAAPEVAVDEKLGGSMVVALQGALTTGGFDIVRSSSTPGDGTVLSQIFEPLFDMDAEGNVIPRLATGYSHTEDGCGLIVTLREDVVFSDGEKFNAEAAAKVFNYYVDPETKHANIANDLSLVTGCEVIDEYTIQINTSSPDAGLLTFLTIVNSAMISPKNIDNGDILDNPIGTGPFKVAEYVEGSHILLVKNDKYWAVDENGTQLPYLDEIRFVFMSDETVRMTNLQSGDIDGMDNVGSASTTLMIMDMENVVTYQDPRLNILFMKLNDEDEILSDNKVREAVSYAVNRQEIIDVAYEGFASLNPFYAREDQWFYSDHTANMEYNPEKAKALLADAGYPDGIDLTIMNISREPDNTIVQLLQSQMAAAGINLKIESMERTAWVETVRTNSEDQLAIAFYGIMGVDATRAYRSAALSYVDPDSEHYARMDELLVQSKKELDDDARYAQLAEIQEIMLDNYLHLILCGGLSFSAYNENVQGLQYYYYGSMDYRGAWVK